MGPKHIDFLYPAVLAESGLWGVDQQGSWHNLLPDPGEEREVLVILDLPDLTAGARRW